MRITVRSGDFKLRIPFPAGLVFNDLTAALVPKIMEQNGMTITTKQARKLIRAMKKYKRRHRDWVLVEVQSADGDYVEIKL